MATARLLDGLHDGCEWTVCDEHSMHGELVVVVAVVLRGRDRGSVHITNLRVITYPFTHTGSVLDVIR